MEGEWAEYPRDMVESERGRERERVAVKRAAGDRFVWASRQASEEKVRAEERREPEKRHEGDLLLVG